MHEYHTHKHYTKFVQTNAQALLVFSTKYTFIQYMLQKWYSNRTLFYKVRISTDERSIVNTHSIDITAKFAVRIKEKQDGLVHVRLLFCPNC